MVVEEKIQQPPRINGPLMGLDIGKVRIGVALSDLSHILASPHLTIMRNSDDEAIDEILQVVQEKRVVGIVAGIPKSLKAHNVIAQEQTKEFLDKLAQKSNLQIIGVDERFTTVLAAQQLREVGHDSRSMKSKIDATAAAGILQSYLDSSERIH